MRWLASAAEFGLVATVGLMLTLETTGAAPPEPRPSVPSADEVAAAVAFAERQAEEINEPVR